MDEHTIPRLEEGWTVTQLFRARCGKCGWKRDVFSEYEGRVQLAEHHCGMINSEIFVSLNQMTLPGDWQG